MIIFVLEKTVHTSAQDQELFTRHILDLLPAVGSNICQRFPIVIEIIPLIEAPSRETTIRTTDTDATGVSVREGGDGAKAPTNRSSSSSRLSSCRTPQIPSLRTPPDIHSVRNDPIISPAHLLVKHEYRWARPLNIERCRLRDDSACLVGREIERMHASDLLLPGLLGRNSRTLNRGNANPRIRTGSGAYVPSQISSG